MRSSLRERRSGRGNGTLRSAKTKCSSQVSSVGDQFLRIQYQLFRRLLPNIRLFKKSRLCLNHLADSENRARTRKVIVMVAILAAALVAVRLLRGGNRPCRATVVLLCANRRASLIAIATPNNAGITMRTPCEVDEDSNRPGHLMPAPGALNDDLRVGMEEGIIAVGEAISQRVTTTETGRDGPLSPHGSEVSAPLASV